MAKKISIIAILTVVIIIISAGCAISVVHNTRLAEVERLTMLESTCESVAIRWKSVNKADGYRIYQKTSDNDYELIKEVDSNTLKYEITELESALIFDIKVTAFNEFFGNTYESEEAEPISVYTLPDKTELKAGSADDGVLNLRWKAQPNVAGYELEYSKDGSFENAEKKLVEGSDKTKLNVNKLKPKDKYYSRIRSYIVFDEENIYGEWSNVAEAEIMEKVVMPANIDPNKPIVALSFDDGPGYPYNDTPNPTAEILDVLEEYGARATFFMCGSRINNLNSDCLKRELKLGCEIGNHTYDHERYGKNVTAKDISRNSSAIKKACGQAPTIFRCTGGMISKTIRDECRSEGMPIAYWSVDTEDWKSKDAEDIYKRAMNGVYDGSIILMHDIYPSTAEAVKKIVPALIKKGYQVVTVSEMLTVKNSKAPKAGEQYVDYKTINNNT